MAGFGSDVTRGFGKRWSELAKVYRNDPDASDKTALGAALAQDVDDDEGVGRRLADEKFAALLEDLGQKFPGKVQAVGG